MAIIGFQSDQATVDNKVHNLVAAIDIAIEAWIELGGDTDNSKEEISKLREAKAHIRIQYSSSGGAEEDKPYNTGLRTPTSKGSPYIFEFIELGFLSRFFDPSNDVHRMFWEGCRQQNLPYEYIDTVAIIINRGFVASTREYHILQRLVVQNRPQYAGLMDRFVMLILEHERLMEIS